MDSHEPVTSCFSLRKQCVYRDCSVFGHREDFFSFPRPCLKYQELARKDPDNETARNNHIRACNTCSLCDSWVTKCNSDNPHFQSLDNVSKRTYLCQEHLLQLQKPTTTVLKAEKIDLEDDDEPPRKIFKIQETPQKTYKVQLVKTTDVQTTLSSNQELPIRQEVILLNLLQYGNSAIKLPQQQLRNVGVQTTASYTRDMPTTKETILLATRKQLLKATLEHEKKKKRRQGVSICDFEKRLSKNQNMSIFYTGFNHNQITELHDFLPITIGHNTRKMISNRQELILTLTRLKSGFLLTDLSYRFGLSSGMISKVFNTWIQLMCRKFSDPPPVIPHRDLVAQTIPKYLSEYKNLRLILDFMQVRCERTNRAPTLFKVLIGYTPNGTICFVSDLMETPVTDRELIERCKLLDLLHEGDRILAVKSIDIREIAAKKGIDVDFVEFAKSKRKADRQASDEKRKFFKQVRSKIKRFKLLQQTMPLNMRPILPQVFPVTCFLSNFAK